MARLCCLFVLLLWPLSSQAQAPATDLATQVQACIDAQIAADAPVAECVNEAQADCLQYPLDAAPDAATKCFLDQKETWGAAIAARMGEIKATADEGVVAVAGIEVKYDLMSNLLQCDRIEELTLLRRDPDAQTRAQDARCESTATGLAFIKLLLQSRPKE